MGEVVINELEEENIYWEAYADASFGNVEDGHMQIGYIISISTLPSYIYSTIPFARQSYL